MTRPERPLWADLSDEVGSVQADLRQMLALRWQLSRLEVEAAVAQIKRLSIGLLICAVMLLVALPILAVAAAWWLDRLKVWEILLGTWLLIFGSGLLLGGIAGGYLAWRRFRRRFAGMEQTLEELREDGVWPRQWAGNREDSQE